MDIIPNLYSTKKLSTQKHQENNRNCAQRMRCARRKFKSELPFKCKQTLYKTVNEVQKALLENISKKVVLEQLLKEYYPEPAARVNKIITDYKAKFIKWKEKQTLNFVWN